MAFDWLVVALSATQIPRADIEGGRTGCAPPVIFFPNKIFLNLFIRGFNRGPICCKPN